MKHTPFIVLLFFFLFGSWDGGLLLLRLFTFKRSANKLITKSNSSISDFVANDISLSSARCFFAFLRVSSMFILFIVKKNTYDNSYQFHHCAIITHAFFLKIYTLTMRTTALVNLNDTEVLFNF